MTAFPRILSEWHARWIWCAGEAQPRNFYLYVRKTLTIPKAVRHADIMVTADSRYQLFVNGVRVARGPARCDRRWQCVDQWDITGDLVSGENVLAALVHHYGEWTFSYMLGRGAFLAESSIECVDGSTVVVATDDSWKVQRAQPWERSLPRMSIQLGYPEVYDARREIGDWLHAGYDDSGWQHATELGTPGIEPWSNFVPREIPPMSEYLMLPERVIDWGEVGPVSTGHYVDLLRVVWNTSNGVAYLATWIWAPREGQFDIHAGSQDAIKLWVNGVLVLSHLVERDPGPDQEIVPVLLRAGWNTVLAKIVQGEGQWHFYFRIEGAGRDALVYSDHKSDKPVSSKGPWKIVGPFPCTGLHQGFDTVFPPEYEQRFDASYEGKNGAGITWITAGVTEESLLPSIAISREQRFPDRRNTITRPDGLLAPGTPTLVHPGAEYGTYVVIDFGKEVTGYPIIEIDGAAGGEIIDMGYGEALQNPDGEVLPPASDITGILNPDRSGVHYADRYICRPGKQRFETFDKRAFRYMQLDVRNLSTPIEVGPVHLNFSTYPVENRGAFSCSDTLLHRIWETGRWTVQLSMEDSYSDSPWRERAQWWGDVRIEALVSYYCFGDHLLVRQGLRHIAQSQNADGLTMAVYPTEWTGGLLPTYTLLWVISLLDYYEYTADIEFVRELLPVIHLAMGYFDRFRNTDGLLENVPHWLFVDWTGVETAGESASVNALYHGALLAAAALSREGGFPDQGSSYDNVADRVRSGMHAHLWNPAINLFHDSRIRGKLSARISEHANCWAIIFGVANDDMVQRIVESVFSKQLTTVRAATPYFSFYVLCALGKAGRHHEALDYIRNRWKRMLDWGATTWWETWEPKASLCHGWSSGPSYFLQAEILGIRAGAPGWNEIHVTPHPGDLAWARGRVATRHGDILVEWKSERDFSMTVTIPSPGLVSVPLRPERDVSCHSDVQEEAWHWERLNDDHQHARYKIHTPGTYRFHSS
jgi:alpha-L-rhamnosidase